jgi:D-alanine transaminase
MPTAYLNGNYLPLEEAQISVLDRGFLFGDGVYEVIPVYNGHLFRLEQDLARLEQSLHAIHFDLEINTEEWRDILQELVQRNGSIDQTIYLQITRGADVTRDLAIPKHCEPTFFAFCLPVINRGYAELEQGMAVITLEDIRWQRCNIKATTLLANALLLQQAKNAGVNEAILIRNGLAMEGITSNLFVVKNNIILTPPLNNFILGGVTRELILELAQQHDMPFQEVAIPVADLISADEIWLTGTTREIMPIIKLNDQIINDGKAGPVWQKIITHYFEFKQSL